MYPRNAASPERIAVGAVVQISDGAVQTSGVAITVRGQGGAEGTGGGTTVYGASGIVYYTPLQAETNFTSFVVIASKTGCIPVAQTIITTASATAGQVVPEDGAITAAKIAADAITDAKVAADVTIASVIGSVGSVVGLTASNLDATVSSRLASASYTAPDNTTIGLIAVYTDSIEGRLPAALVGGRMDASVGAVANDAITADSLAADAGTEIATSVLSAAQTTPIHSDVRKVYNMAIDGAGTEADPWGPV